MAYIQSIFFLRFGPGRHFIMEGQHIRQTIISPFALVAARIVTAKDFRDLVALKLISFLTAFIAFAFF